MTFGYVMHFLVFPGQTMTSMS
uniref:Uncharacterized protein n=1 Tax=Arundo donax TaxID=35708 RepID=A0A0A9A296_ARUDO